MSKFRILFQLSGSIACFKACQVLSRLVQNGHEVEVVATPSALEFIGPATLEGLTGRRVHSDVFASGEYMKHIHLIRWADAVVLCPATANTLNKLANGLGDDLVSTLFLAHDFIKPYIIAPAMNTRMLQHPTTRASLDQLRSWGLEILPCETGDLACGESGDGRLLAPEKIVAAIEARLPGAQIATGLRVLITSGGTKEAIDGVRSITNFSTGATGAAIAAHFARHAHQVTFVRGEDSARSEGRMNELVFRSFDDLQHILRTELGSQSFDAIIHAAAVSDYRLSAIESSGRSLSELDRHGKIDSGDELLLRLSRAPKLVDHLREWSLNRNVRIVGFKLTKTNDHDERERAVQTLASRAHPDLIVHNDLNEITKEHHPARIYRVHEGVAARAPLAHPGNKTEIAREIEQNLLRLIRSETKGEVL